MKEENSEGNILLRDPSEADPSYEELPDSGGKFFSHDLGNVVNNVGWKSETDSPSVFDPETNEPWDYAEDETGPQQLFNAFKELKHGNYESLSEVEDFLESDVPDYAGVVAEWILELADAAQAYTEMRNGNLELESIPAEHAFWAFERDPNVDLIHGDNVEEEYILANDAIKYLSSTLLQNIYDKGVEDEAEVTTKSKGNYLRVSIENPLLDEDLSEEDLRRYDPDTEGGFGIPASTYIVGKMGGWLNVDRTQDSFRLTYHLRKEELQNSTSESL
jgi:hypothetical protein